jgi:hypothetical protein
VEQFWGKSAWLHSLILLFSARAENAVNCLGYHAFFVRAHCADCDPAGRRERAHLFHDMGAKQSQHVLSMQTSCYGGYLKFLTVASSRPTACLTKLPLCWMLATVCRGSGLIAKIYEQAAQTLICYL